MDLALGFILQIFSLFSVLMSKYTIYNQRQQTLCCLNLKKIESDVGSNNSLTLIYSAHNSNQQNKDASKMFCLICIFTPCRLLDCTMVVCRSCSWQLPKTESEVPRMSSDVGVSRIWNRMLDAAFDNSNR